mgnify:CR=1 FL=1
MTACPSSFRDGDLVHDPIDPDYTWQYYPLAWHELSTNGLDVHGCRVSAWIDGDCLRVQHGDNLEAVRWFTLDELNNVGHTWDEWNAAYRWVDEIHVALEREATDGPV